MSIQKVEWTATEYGSNPKDLTLAFTSRTSYVDGTHADRRFLISHMGVGYNIHSCRSPEGRDGLEQWDSAIGLTVHNVTDLSVMLAEYDRRLGPLFYLRQGSAAEQLSRAGS
jgi:hypothetical protein